MKTDSEVRDAYTRVRDAYTRACDAYRGRGTLEVSPQCENNKGATHRGHAVHWPWHAMHIARELRNTANCSRSRWKASNQEVGS